MRIDDDGVISFDETDYVGGLQPTQQNVFDVAPTYKLPTGFTEQDVLDYFNTPGLTPLQAAQTMQQYNVQPEDIASILGLTPEAARAQYNAAFGPAVTAPATTVTPPVVNPPTAEQGADPLAFLENYFDTPGLIPDAAVAQQAAAEQAAAQQAAAQQAQQVAAQQAAAQQAAAQQVAAQQAAEQAAAQQAAAQQAAAQQVAAEQVANTDEIIDIINGGAAAQQAALPQATTTTGTTTPITTNLAPNANNALDVLDAFQKIASVGQTVQNVGSAASAASAATKLAGAADAGTSLFGFDPASLLVSALTKLMFNRKAPSYLDLNPAVPVTPEMNAQSLYDLLQSTEAQPSEFGDTEGRDSLYMALFEEASRLGLDDITNELLQNPYISSMQAASGDTLPEGFVRDREGNIRDATTGGYYSIVNGKPFPRTAPFFPVPMPDLSDAAGGSATAPATNATPASTADQIREYANREGVTAAEDRKSVV
jgi:chemotaxis protein histidine kinase CheA